MRYRILLCMAMLFLLLSACGREEETLPITEPASSLTTVPEITAPQPETMPPQTEPLIPEFSDLEQFRDFLYRQLDAGASELEFYYTGPATDVTAQNIARVGSLFYVKSVHEGELFHVSLWDYPGDRIVKAYRSGNYDTLSADEQQALGVAVEMVAKAKEASHSALEMEIALFDLFRTHVIYNNGTTEISDPDNAPRYLTAVGALLDGSANCQGYADGFYTLAAIAGFDVARMHVDIPDGGHTVNVIRLGENWYVVDATYNDSDDPSGIQVSYRLFNAGWDKCLEYHWDAVMERHPIARQSDNQYYYYMTETAETRAFLDISDMAENVLQAWQAQGLSSRYLMLIGKEAKWSDLADALNSAANARGMAISYHIWTETNGQDTFFYIELQ